MRLGGKTVSLFIATGLLLQAPAIAQQSGQAGANESNRHKFENRFRQSVLVDESNVGSSVGAWLLARVDDVATDLFVALQL